MNLKWWHQSQIWNIFSTYFLYCDINQLDSLIFIRIIDKIISIANKNSIDNIITHTSKHLFIQLWRPIYVNTQWTPTMSKYAAQFHFLVAPNKKKDDINE